MLVYGDHSAEVAPAARLAALAEAGGCLRSHDALRRRFTTLAGLTQAVADADFVSAGVDRERPDEIALLEALIALAAVLMDSWEQGCSGGAAPPFEVPAGLPRRATMRVPEGYAFYALYPEAFGLAARRLTLSGPPLVIGLRSIGTGLAAVAAAVLGAPVPITLRPGGDPFARELRIDPGLSAALLAHKGSFVIVDEGPGLSGSSFGCVADWLEDRGVAPERIAFLPGHSGELGPEASPRRRERWARVQRPTAEIGRVRPWVEALVGPVERWTDLSGGGWRPLWRASEAEWPAVTPMWERTKYLVHANGKDWLVRFAGLGSEGQDKLALARLLRRAGYGPEVAGLTHGWLVQRWHADAEPTRPTLEELGGYLRLRALLPAVQGASLPDLVTMVRRNSPFHSGWNPPVEALQPSVRPVRIDGKLQPYEWLRLPEGRLLKADALDHHQGHDLVGCQDVAWDIAGAAIELELTAEDVRTLEQALEVDPALTRFYRVAYTAFRLGVHRMSEAMVGGQEADRHRAAAARYELALVDAVEDGGDLDQAVAGGIETLA